LLVIDNPELVAELREAEADKAVADAELARINVGTRSEIVAQRKAEIDRASADLTLVQQTYNRTKQLAAEKFAPLSKLARPVLTLDAKGRNWASFNLREDQFGGLRIGSSVELVPADGKDPTQARITEIVARGEFATWRAARVVGDHDLNTFLVRADPVPLQPGMTVWLKPAGGTAQ